MLFPSSSQIEGRGVFSPLERWALRPRLRLCKVSSTILREKLLHRKPAGRAPNVKEL